MTLEMLSKCGKCFIFEFTHLISMFPTAFLSVACLLHRNWICLKPHYSLFLDSSVTASLDWRQQALKVKLLLWFSTVVMSSGCLRCDAYDLLRLAALVHSHLLDSASNLMWCYYQLDPSYCPSIIYILELVHNIEYSSANQYFLDYGHLCATDGELFHFFLWSP